jgi:hypothetical protein
MGSVRRIARRLRQSLTRRARPAPAALQGRPEPLSRVFGLDRGQAIDRYYIERFLAAHSERIRGRVLEVGDTAYTRRFGRAVDEAVALHAGPGAPPGALIADLTRIETLPERRFDCFVCTQTFNFIFDVRGAVEGARHVLVPGGFLLATVAGISQVSRYDMDRWGDFWRFTQAGLARQLEAAFAGGVEVTAYGNVAAATAFLNGLAVEDLRDRAILDAHDPDYPMVVAAVARRAP